MKIFKDLKKGDHLYNVSIDSKTFKPYLSEYELVDDMKFIGPEISRYECHIMPINYNPNEYFYWVNSKWDGTPILWWPGWAWNTDGRGWETTPNLEYAKEYYCWLYKCYESSINKKINKLTKQLNELNSLKDYHINQCNDFDFYIRWK